MNALLRDRGVVRRAAVSAAALMVAVLMPVTAARADEGGFLRTIDEPGKRIALDVAVREYARADGGGPTVGLVAVTHVGEASLYDTLQELLDEYDVVLYESVLPPGAAGPEGATQAERIESTETSLALLAGIIELYHEANEAYPASLDELKRFFAQRDTRLVSWIEATSRDAWGREVVYRLDERDDEVEHDDETDAARGYTLFSRGPANAGSDDEASRRLTADAPLDLSKLTDPDGLQVRLARALRLEFQLTAMDYDRPNWRVSDMAMDQVERAMQQRGAEFDVFAGGMAGTTFASRVVKVLLRMVEAADSMMDGVIADSVKVAIIEMLGDEQLTEQAIRQMGEGFAEVIIDERNKVAMQDLLSLSRHEPDVERVAIFYGAAHMPDFVHRLAEAGYTREIDSRWITAIEVDLQATAVPPRQLRQMRHMIRRSIEQQFR